MGVTFRYEEHKPRDTIKSDDPVSKSDDDPAGGISGREFKLSETSREKVIEMLLHEDSIIHSPEGTGIYKTLAHLPRKQTLEPEYLINGLTLKHFGYANTMANVKEYRSIIGKYYRSATDYDKDVMASVTYFRENKCLYYTSPELHVGDKLTKVPGVLDIQLRGAVAPLSPPAEGDVKSDVKSDVKDSLHSITLGEIINRIVRHSTQELQSSPSPATSSISSSVSSCATSPISPPMAGVKGGGSPLGGGERGAPAPLLLMCAFSTS